MKKYIYLTLCLLLSVSMLLGCGSNEEPAAPTQATADDSRSLEALPAMLWNNADLVFVYIDIKPSAKDAWPDEWANDAEINPGESCELWLDSGEKSFYDIEIIDENEDVWSLLEVPLAPGGEILVFEDQTAWVGTIGGEETNLDVIFTNTENDADYADGIPEDDAAAGQVVSPVGVWEIMGQMDTEPIGEMELMEDGTLITRPKGGAEFETTYSVEGNVVTLHFDDFDLEFQLDGDMLLTSEGSQYAVRK
ncbi:hypothetical protein LJC56_10490 [Christensenellaceae bacterium OttesenSCG-928-K19]|nr:hypothetical protein [Christensenellaceae bacterium OttesenSCG-928-K19]